MTRKSKGRIGSSLDGYLAEEGIREEVKDQALKEIIADLTNQKAMHQHGRKPKTSHPGKKF